MVKFNLPNGKRHHFRSPHTLLRNHILGKQTLIIIIPALTPTDNK